MTPVGGGGIPAKTEGSGTGRFGGGRGAVKPAGGNWLGGIADACEEKYCVRVSLCCGFCPDEGEGTGGAKAAEDVPKIGTWGVTEEAGVGVAELAVEVTSLGGGVLGGKETGLLLSGATPPVSDGCEGIGVGTAGGGGIVPTTGDDITAGGTMGTTAGGTVVVAPISVGLLVCGGCAEVFPEGWFALGWTITSSTGIRCK